MTTSAIELFASIGGLGYGFKAAGFSIELAVELDPRRAQVYQANVKPRRSVAGDVRRMDFSQYRGVDVVIAGPPCRPYSSATPKASRGASHPEYGLDLEVARAVEEVQPKVVVVEEVPGWSPQPLAWALAKLGYSAAYMLIHFADYGVPTTRRRWILVASKGASPWAAFKALEAHRETPPRPIDLLAGLPPEPCHADPCRYGNALIYNHVNVAVNSRIAELIPKIPPGHSLVTAHKAGIIDASYYVDVEKKHSYWLYRPPLDGLVRVVPHPRRSIMLHPVYNRMITVRELARLMSFPDWYNLRPLNLDGMYRSLADAVPPKFSAKLAQAVAKALLW
jgi:DNA (cytosine-5)-methyltransferase 1